MRTFILAGAALLALSTAAVTAQAGDRFSRIDLNHDGRVTFQEFQSAVGSQLMRAKGKHAQKFQSLNPEQQVTVLQKRFQRLDHGGKGYLVPEDMPQRRG